MSLSIVSLIFLAAFLHATWNAIVKTGRDGLLMLATIKLPMALVAGLALITVGLPDGASVPYAAGSAVAFAGYLFFLISAYRAGDLSFVYPVARGSAPLGAILLSGVLLGEWLTMPGLAGALIISIGIVALAYPSRASAWQAQDLFRSLGVGSCIAVYTLLDGVGARASGNALGYTAVVNIFSSVPLLAAVLLWRRDAAAGFIRREWKTGLIGGLMMFSAYGIVIYAMTLGAIGQVAVLRETSVIFATLIGALVLKEPLAAKRIIAATVVAVGIVILLLSGEPTRPDHQQLSPAHRGGKERPGTGAGLEGLGGSGIGRRQAGQAPQGIGSDPLRVLCGMAGEPSRIAANTGLH